MCYTSVLERAAETAAICLDAWEAAGRRRPERLLTLTLTPTFALTLTLTLTLTLPLPLTLTQAARAARALAAERAPLRRADRPQQARGAELARDRRGGSPLLEIVLRGRAATH